MGFTWAYHDAAGAELSSDATASMTAADFPTQVDAESWVGEVWQQLATEGVDSVTLLLDGAKVYGPMSLRAGQ